MSRPVSWLLTKSNLKVCCELSDVEFQGLPQTTLTGLLARGVVVKRVVKVPLEEFMDIDALGDLVGR